LLTGPFAYRHLRREHPALTAPLPNQPTNPRTHHPNPNPNHKAPKPKPAEAAAAAAAAAAEAGAAAAAGDDTAGRAGVFQLGEGGARVVRGVGAAAPVDDFNSLLEGGKVDEALRGMEVRWVGLKVGGWGVGGDGWGVAVLCSQESAGGEEVFWCRDLACSVCGEARKIAP